MARLIIYKDYDIIDEIQKIYMIRNIDGSNAGGVRKDKMLQELIKVIEKSLDCMIEL